MTYDATQFKCPKCGAELSDWWDGEPVSAFVGEWSGSCFRCEGKLVPAKDDRYGDRNQYAWFNRTPSCGYFSLEALGVECREDGNPS